MKYKAIIFDFFGVISSEVAPVYFKKYFPEERIYEIKEKYITPADRGDISYDHLMVQLGALVGATADQVRKDWESEVVINEDIVSLIRKMRSRCKVALLSDAPQEFLRAILRKHNLEELFDVVVISSEVKTIKKDKEIYTMVLNKLGINAREAVFIDDNPNNIRIAEEIGIEGYLFLSDRELIQKIEVALF